MSCCVCQLESNDYLHTKFGINEIFGFSKKKKKKKILKGMLKLCSMVVAILDFCSTQKKTDI
jgi:hypothetical protein